MKLESYSKLSRSLSVKKIYNILLMIEITN